MQISDKFHTAAWAKRIIALAEGKRLPVAAAEKQKPQMAGKAESSEMQMQIADDFRTAAWVKQMLAQANRI